MSERKKTNAVKALFLILFLFGIAVVVGHYMKADAFEFSPAMKKAGSQGWEVDVQRCGHKWGTFDDRFFVCLNSLGVATGKAFHHFNRLVLRGQAERSGLILSLAKKCFYRSYAVGGFMAFTECLKDIDYSILAKKTL